MEAYRQGTITEQEYYSLLGDPYHSDYRDIYDRNARAAAARRPVEIRVLEGITALADYSFVFSDFQISRGGASPVTKVSLPSSLVTIGEYALYNNYRLMDISIPGSVRSIGAHAFDGCSLLNDITIPQGVERIGANAFASIPMSTVSLPESCSNVDMDAFLLTWTSFLLSNGLDALRPEGENNLYIYNDDLILPIRIPCYAGVLEEELSDYLGLMGQYGLLNEAKSLLSFQAQFDAATMTYQSFCAKYPGLRLTEEQYASMNANQGNQEEWTQLQSSFFEEFNNAFDTNYSDFTELWIFFYDETELFPENRLKTQMTTAASNLMAELDAKKAAFSGELQTDTVYLGATLEEGYTPLPWIVIHANPNSKAHQMAQTSGVKFECLNHNYISSVTKPATSDEEGEITYVCSGCGKTYTEPIEKRVIKDPETDISVIFNEWVEGDPDVHLVVQEHVDAGPLPISGDVQRYPVEIKIVNENGEEVQPQQAVEVHMPLPEGYDPAHIVIYHRHSTDYSNVEQITDFRIETVNGKAYIVFTTDSFSTFIIVDTSSKAEPDPQPDPNMCHWCGKVHEGFFQKIIGWFHSILAKLFGAKY